MKKLSVDSLGNYLMGMPAGTIVAVYYESEVRMRKKIDRLPCPWTKASKTARYLGTIGVSHHDVAEAVAEARSPGVELPGAEARKWGNRIGESCLIEKDGVLFLEVVNVNETETLWFLDGVASPREVVEPWLYTHREIISTRTFELSRIRMLEIIQGFDLERIEVIR